MKEQINYEDKIEGRNAVLELGIDPNDNSSFVINKQSLIRKQN